LAQKKTEKEKKKNSGNRTKSPMGPASEGAGGETATAPPSGRLWAQDRRRSAGQRVAHPRQRGRWPVGKPRWPREERDEARQKRDPNWKIDVFRPIRTPMKAILVLMESL